MKFQVSQFAPKPSPEFSKKLERTLLAHGHWNEKKTFNTFMLMKKYSIAYTSGLLILAASAGLFYPLTQEPKGYIALAKEHYENYNWDGILYQKTEIYTASPKETYDADVTFTLESWEYGLNGLTLSEKTAGTMWEGVTSGEMRIVDDSGNWYMYGNPKEFAVKKTPLNEAPYCVQMITSTKGDQTTYSLHAFEVSPSALGAFDTIYLSKNDDFSFDQDGELNDYMYMQNANYTVKNVTTVPEEFTEDLQFDEALFAASSSPKQAQMLFDLLSNGNQYTESTKMDEFGQTLEVFRLPPKPFNPTESDADLIEEYVFNDQYDLVEVNSYKDDELMNRVKYIKTATLPLSESDSIFDPEKYGMELVAFTHPIPFDNESIIQRANTDEFSCYSFQNEPLTEEETQKIAVDYAPMIQNLKDNVD